MGKSASGLTPETNSFTSPPAQKAFPAPVITMPLPSLSATAVSKAERISCLIPPPRAFRESGRFRVIVPIPSSLLNNTNSQFISLLPFIYSHQKPHCHRGHRELRER